MTTQTTKLGLIFAGAIAIAGCELGVEGDELLEDQIGNVQEALCPRGCGGWENGIRQAAWNHVAGDGFKPYRLSQYGAGSSTGPYSICERWRGSRCVVREGWIRWATNDYTDGWTRTLRTEVFLKMLMLIGAPGQAYDDYIERGEHAGTYYELEVEGAWGLATHALGNKWSYADMERITGGLILLLNAKGVHVEVAMRTEKIAPPSEQPNTWQFDYEEAIAYGNVFKSNKTVIAGGFHAPNPLQWARFSEMNVTSTRDVLLYKDSGCVFSSTNPSYENRIAYSCKDAGGHVWEYPVIARLRYIDYDWQLDGTVTVSKPGGGTKIDY